MKKPLKILIWVLGILILLAAGGTLAFRKLMAAADANMTALAATEIRQPDLSRIPDGTYTGEVSRFPLEVKVEVTMENHRITRVNLIRHQNGQGGGAEILPARIVETQRVDLDTVSGATYSSKAILTAVETALTEASGL